MICVKMLTSPASNLSAWPIHVDESVLHFSKQVSWRTRVLVVSDWTRRFIFGRDSSRIWVNWQATFNCRVNSSCILVQIFIAESVLLVIVKWCYAIMEQLYWISKVDTYLLKQWLGISYVIKFRMKFCFLKWSDINYSLYFCPLLAKAKIILFTCTWRSHFWYILHKSEQLCTIVFVFESFGKTKIWGRTTKFAGQNNFLKTWHIKCKPLFWVASY